MERPRDNDGDTPMMKGGAGSHSTFRNLPHLFVVAAYEDPYVQPLILDVLQKHLDPQNYTLLPPSVAQPGTADSDEIPLSQILPERDPVHGDSPRVLQITPYEAIDWDYVANNPRTCMVNSYMLRKALIRKHYLSTTVDHWVAKRPDSVLKTHVARSEAFELDYAEFLDDALVECFDLRESLERNAAILGGREAASDPADESVTEAGSDSATEAGSETAVEADTESPVNASATKPAPEPAEGILEGKLEGGCDDEVYDAAIGGHKDPEFRDLMTRVAKNQCTEDELSRFREVRDKANEQREEKNREDYLRMKESAQPEVQWWILKPSMSDRGQGIRLFSTMEELQGIFDEWEAEQPDSDDEEEEDEAVDGEEATGRGKPTKSYITTSHLRHFVAQPYIQPPLVIPLANAPPTGFAPKHKFHIRTYVACVGNMDVYVYRPMLVLFAAKPYEAPGQRSQTSRAGAPNEHLDSHLTNTCLQRSAAAGTVAEFWSADVRLSAALKERVFDQICAVTGETFEAAARAMRMHFAPLPNAFELYGLDFLVDVTGRAWLLEVNAFPDFKQSGPDLDWLVRGLWEETLLAAVGPFFGVPRAQWCRMMGACDGTYRFFSLVS
ncbi:tubulin-tyrosine ligase family-domain-containing protein [Xylariomycetidae sp. FL0641]|nr:tubulin-tyrosine ligase family-domain-containing protein [Xylariomycetidae sp. FL0641]